jgi:hypothetical protein
MTPTKPAPTDADEPQLERHYEGQPVLADLLKQAGSHASVDDTKEIFMEAQAEGMRPAQAFPELFDGEPRFASPALALRLYSNLFGLWDRMADGKTDEPSAHEPKPRPPPPPPAPEPLEKGKPLTDAFVEAAFAHLSATPAREARRHHDRFEQKESDLIQAIAQLKVDPPAEEAALQLAFELWAISQLAYGDDAGRTTFAKLRAGEGTAPEALVRYIDESLTEAEIANDDAMSADDRAKLEPLLRAAAGQLTSVSAS